MGKKVLLVDDDYSALAINKQFLLRKDPEIEVLFAGNQQQAIEVYCAHLPQVVVLDLCLNPVSGVESGYSTLKEILAHNPQTRVIVLTGHAEDQYGIRALESGAANFLTKPVNHDYLYALIHDSINQVNLRRAYQQLLSDQKSFIGKYFSGESSYVKELIRQIEFAASTNQAILITGETGTGKSYIAELIHQFSSRAENKFIRLQPVFKNSDLVSSELFGHHKGSFTGANSERAGLFSDANGGTLFLDELDAFSSEVQVALLGVLQTKKFRPLGSNQEYGSDFRLISATNQEIEKAVTAGRIRQDLFFRIAQVQIHLLPLRERRQDIVALATKILSKYSQRQLSADASKQLQAYDWPGNIRELDSVLLTATERARFANRQEITIEDLNIKANVAAQDLAGASLHDQVEVYRANVARASVLRNNNSKSRAAKELGIDRSTLQRILNAVSTK